MLFLKLFLCLKLCIGFRPLMTSIYDSLFSRLEDNIAPVREAAAIALGCIVAARGKCQRCMQTDVHLLQCFFSLVGRQEGHLS